MGPSQFAFARMLPEKWAWSGSLVKRRDMPDNGMSAKGWGERLAAQLPGLYSELEQARAHLARWNSLGKRLRGTRDERWKRVRKQRAEAVTKLEKSIRKLRG
jgi:hypothetical protein